MTPSYAKQILAELQRRTKKPINVLSSAFDKQLAAINDPAKLKSISCTRRASKSYTSGLALFHKALNFPRCNVLYIGLTRDSAKRIMWKDVLREINDKHKVGAKPNIAELSLTLPNGSVIYLLGADADSGQMSKVLGQKFALAIVDEAASYTINLRELVFGVLKPAVADLRGEIWLTGTAGNLVKGLFYDVTIGREPGWSRHSWTTFDNPFMAKQWAQEIEELKAANPLIVETALFKQMYLNQWVVDSDKLVYKYSHSRNCLPVLPIVRGAHQYILGIDLGYNDETAFVVSLYSKLDPTLYIVRTLKKAKLDLTEVARITKELDAEYEFDTKIVDGSNKQAVAELNNRHNLNLIAADKTGKSDFIEIFNAELVLGRIKVVESGGAPLIEEWSSLIWDDKTLVRREHPNCPNHLCDAALYAWRFTYTYLSRIPETKASEFSPQWYRDKEKEMLKKAEDRYEKAKLEKEWDVWQTEDEDGWNETEGY